MNENLNEIKTKVAKKYGYRDRKDTEFLAEMYKYVDEIVMAYVGQESERAKYLKNQKKVKVEQREVISYPSARSKYADNEL
ncbi:MAG: hypothetical protein WCT77_06010 [Bacteroidota bacterium]|jgi:hypothetical protein